MTFLEDNDMGSTDSGHRASAHQRGAGGGLLRWLRVWYALRHGRRMLAATSRAQRRYRQVHGLPDLPGIWRSPQHFYYYAKESVVEHEDGWSTAAGGPDHRFVAWEMAVRYEAACQEIKQHYIQICDGPTAEEWRCRIDRIASLVSERERLSKIESTVRPMLPDNPDGLRPFVLPPPTAGPTRPRPRTSCPRLTTRHPPPDSPSPPPAATWRAASRSSMGADTSASPWARNSRMAPRQ